MSKDVFVVTYEVPADRPEVVEFNDAVRAADAQTLQYVESVGGVGFYTTSLFGTLHGVIFPDLIGRAEHWKVLDRVDGGVLCVPKRTKVAAETRAEFDAAPAIPQPVTLARALGWSGARPTDGRKTYWATVSQLALPSPRVMLRLPRQIGDGWEVPPFFIERSEGDYMRAIEAHNALVRP